MVEQVVNMVKYHIQTGPPIPIVTDGRKGTLGSISVAPRYVDLNMLTGKDFVFVNISIHQTTMSLNEPAAVNEDV